jgi:hypothetical protein
VLDKVVPLFSYRFYDNLDTFADKGSRLVKRIQENSKVQNKAEFIALIDHAKDNWLDTLIELRDEYAHYSNLKEYANFWIPAEAVGKQSLTGIQDFHRPSIIVGGIRRDAREYMEFVKSEIVQFLGEFVRLCDYTGERRPRHYLACEHCGFTFASRQGKVDRKGPVTLTSPHVQIRIKDRARDYGVIVCPKCGGTTDTDLQYWKDKGFAWRDSSPQPTKADSGA